MKYLAVKDYETKLSKLRGLKNLENDRTINTKDLIEVVLDQVPTGGFTPKDIRDRNRIQKVLDDGTSIKLSFEDEDFKNLTHMVNSSRWGSRDKDLVDFLENFSKESSE